MVAARGRSFWWVAFVAVLAWGSVLWQAPAFAGPRDELALIGTVMMYPATPGGRVETYTAPAGTVAMCYRVVLQVPPAEPLASQLQSWACNLMEPGYSDGIWIPDQYSFVQEEPEGSGNWVEHVHVVNRLEQEFRGMPGAASAPTGGGISRADLGAAWAAIAGFFGLAVFGWGLTVGRTA